MNKQQLADELSGRVGGVSRAQTEKMLEELTRVITERLIAGEDITIAGFGAFSSRKRKGRIGVNPRNIKEQIEIPSVKVAKFKPGKNLKDALKRSDRTPMPENPSSDETIKNEMAETLPETSAEITEKPTEENQY
ncbi:MAG: DNA-binding protein [Parcubacteria group bacterium CG10_big_fil_rev_8_21_14_0_10_36_14]|nr:MAG: DNA-binding protein [Parcubacteria group bacterium CG10_big_fil_rev_8_21_14_0_10_36_14]